MDYNLKNCPKMLGSGVMAVFAHLEDCFELSKKAHRTMHTQRDRILRDRELRTVQCTLKNEAITVGQSSEAVCT